MRTGLPMKTKPLHQMRSERADSLSAIADIGEAMLECGADVHTVEETLILLGRSYGAARMNVLVITVEIVVTAVFPPDDELTVSRRILSDGSSDFSKLEALSALCRECYDAPLPAAELKRRCALISSSRISSPSLYIGGMLAAAGFAVFFGGSLLDGVAAAVFSMVACAAIRHFKPIAPNVIIFNFVTALALGALVCFGVSVVPQVDVGMVIVGVIMLLIPGVAMTNATRDALSGDTVSGVMRFVESLLWALALALGFMAALWAAGLVGAASSGADRHSSWPVMVMLPVTFVASMGFALLFNVRKGHVAIASLGGVVAYAAFELADAALGSMFISALIASTVAAVYSETLAFRLKVPDSTFFIISVIPIVPGRYLYYTMYSAVNMAWDELATFGSSALMTSAGIAAGICLVAAFMQIVQGLRAKGGSVRP